MKKAKKMIVSGVAGLVLLSVGAGVGAKYVGGWEGAVNVEEVHKNISALGNKIKSLEEEKETLMQEKSRLEGTEEKVKTAFDELVEQFVPEYKHYSTTMNLDTLAALIPGFAKSSRQELEVSLSGIESQLGIKESSKNKPLLERFELAKEKSDELARKLGDVNKKLSDIEAVVAAKDEKISDLNDTISDNNTKNSALEEKLNNAKKDVEELQKYSSDVLEDHKNVKSYSTTE